MALPDSIPFTMLRTADAGGGTFTSVTGMSVRARIDGGSWANGAGTLAVNETDGQLYTLHATEKAAAQLDLRVSHIDAEPLSITLINEPTLAEIRADIERTGGMLEATKDNSDTIDGKLPADTATKIGLIEAMRGTNSVPLTAAALGAATPADLNNLTINKRLAISVANQLERPETGSTAYQIIIVSRDSSGDPVALDAVPTLTAEDATGTNLSAKLSAASAISGETGYYKATYTVASGDSLVGLLIKASGAQSSSAVSDMALSTVVDTIAVDFTASDRTLLNATKNTADAAANNATLAASRAGEAKTAAESVDGKLTTARAGKLDNIETKENIAAEVNSVVEAGQVGQDANAAKTATDKLDLMIDNSVPSAPKLKPEALLLPSGQTEVAAAGSTAKTLDQVESGGGGATTARSLEAPGDAWVFFASRRVDNTFDCDRPLRLTAGAVTDLRIGISMARLYKRTPVSLVESQAIDGGDITVANPERYDQLATLEIGGVAVAGEQRTITATVTMGNGDVLPVSLTVEVA